MARIHIGTSGWHYGHWVGPVYPRDMRPRDFLAFYARTFKAVEINSSFYRLPTRKALTEWRNGTPDDFVFACKASRFTTHMTKLKDPARNAGLFFGVIDALGEKLGPVLFQLPPGWRVNVERLSAFLDGLPACLRYAFELRNETWFTPEVDAVLAAHNAAFCIYELNRRRSPVKLTADFAYVRLHGPGGPYQGRYDGRTLAGWARRLRAWQQAGRDVYCFFDNDEAGYAFHDARRLQAMVERAQPG